MILKNEQMKTFKITLLAYYLIVLPNSTIIGQNIFISIADTTYNTITKSFFGIQYHTNTFSNVTAIEKLIPLKLNLIRIWAEIGKFHPSPNVWNWDELDKEVDEIIAAGYEPIPCLWGEKWFVGSKGSPWWNYPDAILEWGNAAYELANRYKGKIKNIIVYDELNMLKSEEDYYCPFKLAAHLYIKAAKQIKRAEPEIKCGGPSGHLGWENGHWADYVLNEPEGKENIDFVSANVFLSWNGNDSDSLIMNRTIWYEEVPQIINYKIKGRADMPLLLDAYNVSAVWKKDCEPWTDPRNTNIFGAIYQALALLHSAKGGFKNTLRWEVLGGFGIFNWYPQFNELPPYFSWKFLIEVAGLNIGSKIIGCTTTEIPNPYAQHHAGMNVSSYKLQPFAIKRADGGISIILINKDINKNLTATVITPEGMHGYKTYLFNAANVESCFDAVDSAKCENSIEITVPPYSVTIIKYYDTNTKVNTREAKKLLFLLEQNYPNPFNPTTTIKYTIPNLNNLPLTKVETTSRLVTLKIYDVQGKEVATLLNETKQPGRYSVQFNATNLPSGIYFYRLTNGSFVKTKPMILLK